jgi:hypothetical protein
MTDEERTRSLIEAGRWSTGVSRLRAACEWADRRRQDLASIRMSQWEALARAGERSQGLRELYATIHKFLRGAALRDKAGHSWGQKGLVSELLRTMRLASRPDPGRAESELRQAMRKLPADSQSVARRRMRQRACRQFIGFLLMRVKVERRSHGGGTE